MVLVVLPTLMILCMTFAWPPSDLDSLSDWVSECASLNFVSDRPGYVSIAWRFVTNLILHSEVLAMGLFGD